MNCTAYEIASRFVGIKEVIGPMANPQILAMLRLDDTWPDDDEVPWCSAFVNYIAWLLRLPRSKSLRARSWLGVGKPILLQDARGGFDIAVFSRGEGKQPGPEVIDAPGHVAFFGSLEMTSKTKIDQGIIWALGGNQANSVNVRGYPINRLLGIRRLV